MTGKVFYLGPFGNLRELPGVPTRSVVEANFVLNGGVHESLRGGLTRDVFGGKTTWSFDWPFLFPADLVMLESYYQRLTRAPLKMIDPQRLNRASANAASGGSFLRSTDGWAGSYNTPIAWAKTTPPDDLVGLVDGGVLWSVLAETTVEHRLNADYWPESARIPALPGEQITVSAYVAGSGDARIGARVYDSAMVEGTELLGPTVTLTAAWQRLVLTGTPLSTTAAYHPTIRALPGAARDIRVTGVQIETGPSATAWTPGKGSPRVIVTDLQHSYPAPGEYTVSATIQEA